MTPPEVKIYPKVPITKDIHAYYAKHIDHMTTESLYSKSEIAWQLAWRDKQIDDLQGKSDEVQISFNNLIHQLEHGCGNSGCLIKNPTGQATQGSCGCWPRKIKKEIEYLSRLMKGEIK